MRGSCSAGFQRDLGDLRAPSKRAVFFYFLSDAAAVSLPLLVSFDPIGAVLV